MLFENYLVLPYKLTSLDFLCYLNLGDHLQGLLKQEISLKAIQDIKGESSIALCKQMMSYDCADILFRYFYSNTDLLRNFMLYIANDMNEVLQFPSTFIHKIFQSALIESNEKMPSTMGLRRSPTILMRLTKSLDYEDF